MRIKIVVQFDFIRYNYTKVNNINSIQFIREIIRVNNSPLGLRSVTYYIFNL